jgi:acyl-CoA synthetase (AMP-forming)/AMP-acid ligase II
VSVSTSEFGGGGVSALMDVPELPRISDYLFFHASRCPEREFAVLDGQRLTYAEVADRVSALSRILLEHGVRVGDRVAALSTPRPEFAIALLATVDIGAVYVGLNPKYQMGELRHVVDDSQPKVLIGLTEHRGRRYDDELRALHASGSVKALFTIDGEIEGTVSLDALVERGRGLDDAPRLAARAAAGGRQPAIIVYTSGTTGAPKGAVLSHKSLTWSFLRQAKRWGTDPMRIICNLPVNHSGCLGDIFSTCLTAGGTLVFMEHFDAGVMLDLIQRERVNTLMQVPTMYQVLARHPAFAQTDLSSLEVMVWGGAAMPRAVLEAFARPGLATEVVYGQTEAPASVTHSDRDATIEHLTETLGRPDKGLEVRIAHYDGTPCAIGEPGEIQVRHPSIFLGYHGNPEATGEAFTEDGFLRTGDQAVERPDGYFKMVGRLKEMFKSGGYNVYPREIELCLERHPSVLIAVVVSVSDPLYDEIGYAFIVLRPGAEADEAELVEWCRGQLANYKVPKSIVIRDALPTLPIGKPDKRALQAEALQLRDAASVASGDGREPEKEAGRR